MDLVSTCVAPIDDGDDPALCGAPATDEREIEGVVARLCHDHAADVDMRAELEDGTYTSAQLRRLAWPRAWMPTVSEPVRAARERAVQRFVAEALETIRATPDGVAVQVEDGEIVGVEVA